MYTSWLSLGIYYIFIHVSSDSDDRASHSYSLPIITWTTFKPFFQPFFFSDRIYTYNLEQGGLLFTCDSVLTLESYCLKIGVSPDMLLADEHGPITIPAIHLYI